MIHLLMQAKKGTLQGDENAATHGKTVKPSKCSKIYLILLLGTFFPFS
jgi:hypothetical protein